MDFLDPSYECEICGNTMQIMNDMLFCQFCGKVCNPEEK